MGSPIPIGSPLLSFLYIENLTIISGLIWHNHHHMFLIFTCDLQVISLAIPKQALTISALTRFEELAL